MNPPIILLYPHVSACTHNFSNKAVSVPILPRGQLMNDLTSLLTMDEATMFRIGVQCAGCLSAVLAWYILRVGYRLTRLTGVAACTAVSAVAGRLKHTPEESAQLVLDHLGCPEAIVEFRESESTTYTELVTGKLIFKFKFHDLLSITTDAGYNLLPDLHDRDIDLIQTKALKTIALVNERDRLERLRTIPRSEEKGKA